MKRVLRPWLLVLGVAWMLTTAVAAPPKKVPPLFPYGRIGVANGCFVESVAFGDELERRFTGSVWYRVLQWGAKSDDEVVAGHAVVVFERFDRLWAYDINYGFIALETPLVQRDEVAVVAKEVTAPYVGQITPRYPIYLQNFEQSPDETPPVASNLVQEPDVRDAELVAVRLAKYRPVRLVEFTYPKKGVMQRGAAVAFVYNGRLCVYSAPQGTVPFRVKALNLSNLRQLQDLLRRIHPGLTELEPR